MRRNVRRRNAGRQNVLSTKRPAPKRPAAKRPVDKTSDSETSGGETSCRQNVRLRNVRRRNVRRRKVRTRHNNCSLLHADLLNNCSLQALDMFERERAPEHRRIHCCCPRHVLLAGQIKRTISELVRMNRTYTGGEYTPVGPTLEVCIHTLEVCVLQQDLHHQPRVSLGSVRRRRT
ncbi:hypothetical protein C0Q70_04377 [Pomacea canaliculata]|uniref:Uncharacterized protein n=1 Tax=Pomacea canaliculata TaxID=400727 RepID=A0A2T7PVE1_POMCA|nr:hypothetical protein C0Q70_04377 [Pomacea canaliculata]